MQNNEMFWKIFEKTGKIDAYCAYKSLEDTVLKKETKGISDGSF